VSERAAAAPQASIRVPSGDGIELDGHLARPEDVVLADRPAVVLVHNFPSGEVWADRIGADLPSLADRIAEQMQWTALSIRFRGCGQSTGDFSLQGWIDDVGAAVSYLRKYENPDRIWLCGFGSGGLISLVAASLDPEIAGVCTLGSPGDFKDWAANPNRLLAHAKRVGAIKSESFPADLSQWKQELASVDTDAALEKLRGLPMLILHGSDDEVVPHFDPLVVRDAVGNADLRTIRGAGHLLRHDPRAIAILLGWLVRQRLALLGVQDEPADT